MEARQSHAQSLSRGKRYQPLSYRVHIRKEALKFSSAHMTVFPNGPSGGTTGGSLRKEALHGHNYRTELTAEFPDEFFDGAPGPRAGRMVAFEDFKRAMGSICKEWDEKVLLAERCPGFEIILAASKGQSSQDFEFRLCGKRYVLPQDEVVLLPVDNIITERLAREFGRLLLERLGDSIVRSLTRLEIKIEETDGQGASWEWRA